MLQPENSPGRRACPGAAGTSPQATFRPDRFQLLSTDGRALISDWATRAQATLARPVPADRDNQSAVHRSSDTFEAFIYAWISFNGWASCCCDTDRDRELINVLRSDERVSASFESLIRSDPGVAGALDGFRSLWPIFQASGVRADFDAHAEYRNHGTPGLVAYYSREFPRARRAPDCHLRHPSGVIERDWAHTLEALYQVRCNLFHGTKSVLGDRDREVVDAASAVLVPVVQHLVRNQFD